MELHVVVILVAMVVLPFAGAVAAGVRACDANGRRQAELTVLSAVLGLMAVVCAAAAGWLFSW